MAKMTTDKNQLWGMPIVVDNENKILYIKCSSSITAMGIPALVNKYYPGYKGKLVSEEYLNKLRNQQVQF